MGKASRDKGARGEREVAAVFRENGYPEADRGARLGKSGDDVLRVEDCHIECKRTERLSLWESLAQAERDAPEGTTPILAFRRNRATWKAALELVDLIRLLRARRTLVALREISRSNPNTPLALALVAARAESEE